MMHKIKPSLQKYRFTVIALFMLAVIIWVEVDFGVSIAEVLFSSKREVYGNKSEAKILFSVFGFMVVIALFLNKYLSSDDEDSSNTNIHIENVGSGDNAVNLINESERRLKEELHCLQALFDELSLETKRKAGDSLNDSQREELVSTLKEQLLSTSSEELLKDLRDKTNRVIERSTSDRLANHFNKTIQRLTSEIKSLEKRSRVNLIIGSLTAFAGVSIFILFVFENVGNTTAQTYLVTEFAPRISLVIVIELFAYFFLGLYKSNLSEIKHFHNELTNVEHKFMALEESLALADTDVSRQLTCPHWRQLTCPVE